MINEFPYSCLKKAKINGFYHVVRVGGIERGQSLIFFVFLEIEQANLLF
jgi:hypothetical protein